MSSMTRLDTEKLRTRRIIATATLTVFMITFLLFTETPAAVSGMPPAAQASYQAAEAEHIPAGQTAGEAAQYQDPDESTGENNVQTASTGLPVRPQEQ